MSAVLSRNPFGPDSGLGLRVAETSVDGFRQSFPEPSLNALQYPAKDAPIVYALFSQGPVVTLSDSIETSLKELGSLESGWDGEDADPVTPAAIQGARQLLLDLLKAHRSLRKPSLVPTVDGCIQIEWHEADRSLEFSFTGEYWTALGVEIHPDRSRLHLTNSLVGPESATKAAKCYKWFVWKDTRRAPWPLR